MISVFFNSFHVMWPSDTKCINPSESCPSHLRCDVVRGAAEGACGHAIIHVLLTHAEVSDFDVALGVQHDVVELQIPAAETGREHLWTYLISGLIYDHFDSCILFSCLVKRVVQTTNNNFLVWNNFSPCVFFRGSYYSVCVCAYVSCLTLFFLSLLIHHSVNVRMQDMKDGCESLAEVLMMNWVT